MRDFIYIDDAVQAIIKIANSDTVHKVFNLGSGYGTSIRQVLTAIESALQLKLDISWLPGRAVDVPVNYLDISRYESAFGPLSPVPLETGVLKTAAFMKEANMV